MIRSQGTKSHLLGCKLHGAFVLEVPLRNLRHSMCDFAPCNWIVQKGLCATVRLQAGVERGAWKVK